MGLRECMDSLRENVYTEHPQMPHRDESFKIASTEVSSLSHLGSGHDGEDLVGEVLDHVGDGVCQE